MSKLRKLVSHPTLYFYDLFAKRLNRAYAGTKGLSMMETLACQVEKLATKIENDLSSLTTYIAKITDVTDKLTSAMSLFKSNEQRNGELLVELSTRLQKLERILDDRIPFSHNDIRRSLEAKTGWHCADFILKNMQKDGVPFPWRTSHDLLRYALSLVSLEGLILEFGVYQGRTIGIISSSVPDKTVYGFDSFDGLPETWRPNFSKGMFALNSPPPVASNVHLVRGLFQDTLSDFLILHKEAVAFLHIDCDLYSSAKYVLFSLKERIIPGTIIVFDEFYNYIGWENGEFKAFSEFILETGKQFAYLGYSREQVAVVIT